MKVLFLSAWFPYPPDNGARIRVFNLLKALARKHEVYLVSLMQEDSNPQNAEYLTDICRIVSLHKSRWFDPGTFKSALGYFSTRPRSVVDTYNPLITIAVKDAIAEVQPDLLIASTLGVVEYVPQGLDMPVILEQHNCEYAVLKRSAEMADSALKRMRLGIGWRKFRNWEAEVCRGYDKVVMVSERDKYMMLKAAIDLRDICVVPNGVDTDYYNPESRLPVSNLLIYNGALTYNANLNAVRCFASDILPSIRIANPGAKLFVTGRTDGVELAGIADNAGVELTGYVEDMRDILNKAAVCVVPLREGGGSRLKILEAMAAGVPVVSTSMGAEGIDAVDKHHLLIADTPTDFAYAVNTILSNPDAARSLAVEARKLVERRYSWKVVGELFNNAVESVYSRCSERVKMEDKIGSVDSHS